MALRTLQQMKAAETGLMNYKQALKKVKEEVNELNRDLKMLGLNLKTEQELVIVQKIEAIQERITKLQSAKAGRAGGAEFRKQQLQELRDEIKDYEKQLDDLLKLRFKLEKTVAEIKGAKESRTPSYLTGVSFDAKEASEISFSLGSEEELKRKLKILSVYQQEILSGLSKEAKRAKILKETTKQFESQKIQIQDRIKLVQIGLEYGEDSLELEKAVLQQRKWQVLESARDSKMSEYHVTLLNRELNHEINLLLLAKKQRQEKEKLLELEKEREAFEKRIEGFLESGFMSMIDGTKSVTDAFRSMARDVIKELYRILVVQQIVNQAKGAITNLSGYVFSANGNGI